MGPFSVPSALLFLLTGGGLLYYFQSEKKKVEARRLAEKASAKVGRPRIGGPFELVAASIDPKTGTPSGAKVTHEDLQGAFSLVYFGFTNCPDICPEELDKMGTVVDAVSKEFGPVVQPVFVSCDPARDTLAATAKYVADFHPLLLGLTGTYDAVKNACKAYRVYFSTPPGADPSGDYLVDHSIFFYLMDPEGRFVEAFGRSVGPEETTEKVKAFIKQWKDAGNDIRKADAKVKIFTDPARRVEAEAS
ncbi:SCO1 protein [Tilletiaria anomala UBC 951]|uniref:SCO1 protein n=1 Tax=Tilletiaria anomala (strain ATCC 24038 / CBS 436.72 / UBC 951) TaxID=1037660 RepID=A0A066VDE5_TILAU|nr:SCO1 protein [Tilletiaria anomala UBC 951]KDN39762.1 SCO1 protein [Tilletiaria anomala UBC 951]